jgi:tetratricopeptide (TPR) repeat protein
MKKLNLIKLSHNLNHINKEDVILLDNIISKFPFFQNAQILLAKGLLNIDSIRYNRQLKKAAVHSYSRKKLFDIITSNNVTNDQSNIISSSDLSKKNIEINKPLNFDKNENHSFSEWLNVVSIKKIDRSDKNLVANFLQKESLNLKQKKETFFKATDVARLSIIEDLVTPTLARVYLEQEYYEKAISTYKKLILKYPKKSSFFAGQIKLIRKLNIK